MKLLYCKNCQDVIRLQLRVRKCKCKKTSGKYTDNLNAWYKGEHAIPVGFYNPSLKTALINQPESGEGRRFEAFVIPKQCDTFVKKDDVGWTELHLSDGCSEAFRFKRKVK